MFDKTHDNVKNSAKRLMKEFSNKRIGSVH